MSLAACDAISSFFGGSDGPVDSCDELDASAWCAPYLIVQPNTVQPTLPTLGVYVSIQAGNAPGRAALSIFVQNGSLFDAVAQTPIGVVGECVQLPASGDYEIAVAPSAGTQQASLFVALVSLDDAGAAMPDAGAAPDATAEAGAEEAGDGSPDAVPDASVVAPDFDDTLVCPGTVAIQKIALIASALPVSPDASTDASPASAGSSEGGNARTSDAGSDATADSTSPVDGAFDGE